jgi:hypothetical protein
MEPQASVEWTVTAAGEQPRQWRADGDPWIVPATFLDDARATAAPERSSASLLWWLRAPSAPALVRLWVRPAPSHCPSDAGEPNDSEDSATVVAEGAPLPPLHLCPGDEDWFARDLAAGERLDAELWLDAPEGELQLALYEKGNTSPVATSAGSGSPQRLSWRSSQATTVSLVVRGRGPSSNEYALTTEVVHSAQACPDFDFAGPSASAAALLPLGERVGLAVCPTRPDWFYRPVGLAQNTRLRVTSPLPVARLSIEAFQGDTSLGATSGLGAAVLDLPPTTASVHYKVSAAGTDEPVAYRAELSALPSEDTCGNQPAREAMTTWSSPMEWVGLPICGGTGRVEMGVVRPLDRIRVSVSANTDASPYTVSVWAGDDGPMASCSTVSGACSLEWLSLSTSAWSVRVEADPATQVLDAFVSVD